MYAVPGMVDDITIRRRFKLIERHLDERMRRLVAAAEAEAVGFGGASVVARATGVSRRAIRIGARELKQAPRGLSPSGRIRQPGGGRKRTVTQDPTLALDLESLIEPVTRGDPETPLRWTAKSVRRLSGELKRMGHRASHRMVAEMLHQLGYSLQANAKTMEGASHPDRNAQFEHINQRVRQHLKKGDPVISVDTKKKELVGDFQPKGREWQPTYQPEEVRVHDFADKTLGKAIPYGVYDVTRDAGWVSVGIDHDTAEFAVAAVRQWWQRLGQPAYPEATELLVIADGGGSNGSRNRLWKWALQQFADATGLKVTVCHFPPGTSKWNKIEHRMFCYISQNWRGRPLGSLQVIVSLIGTTKTTTGLTIEAALDTNLYPVGRKVGAEQYATIHLHRSDFHGDWNYTITPH